MQPTQSSLSQDDIQKLRKLFSHIRAVIFDMDGLMIDSEPFHCKAFDHVLRQFGKELTEEVNNSLYVGLSDIDIAIDMVNRFGLSISPEDVAKQKQAAYLHLIKNVTPQPGLRELLSHLDDAAMKTAIASSSMLTEIFAVTDGLDITYYFDVFCSAEEVEHGKPAPDIFLYAAQKIGLPPDQCLVLEDAPKGIEAAKAAGMMSIAIPSRETMDKDFSLATVKLSSLFDVMQCFVTSNY